LMAPGEAVWVLRPKSKTEIIVDPGSGTSFATACTAGAVATWLGFHGRDALIARYGRANLARIAKLHLRSLTEKEGAAGVLDMVQLLKAPLPDPLVLADGPGERPAIDPSEAAASLGLGALEGTEYADELAFRATVAKLSTRAPIAAPSGGSGAGIPPVGPLGALESVATAPALALPMSSRLAIALGKPGGI
jgi:hypothetical protein